MNLTRSIAVTPKGLYSTAQGCRAAATLGGKDRECWNLALPRPRVAAARQPWAVEYNPFGVDDQGFAHLVRFHLPLALSVLSVVGFSAISFGGEGSRVSGRRIRREGRHGRNEPHRRWRCSCATTWRPRAAIGTRWSRRSTTCCCRPVPRCRRGVATRTAWCGLHSIRKHCRSIPRPSWRALAHRWWTSCSTTHCSVAGRGTFILLV